MTSGGELSTFEPNWARTKSVDGIMESNVARGWLSLPVWHGPRPSLISGFDEETIVFHRMIFIESSVCPGFDYICFR